MLRSEYIAKKFLIPMPVKAKKIMGMDKPFAFRLAALIAADTRKGKVWH